MRSSPTSCARRRLCWLLATLLVSITAAATSSPILNVAARHPLLVAGDFAGLSLVENNQQVESTDPNTDSIFLERNGVYERIASVDGTILATCTSNDIMYVGGHFTRVNGTVVNNIAQYNIQTHILAPLADGLNGPVHALYCDQGDIYVGGAFQLASGTAQGGAIQWNASSQSWASLPWEGFNGPVYTITANPNVGILYFGGQFDATGDGRYTNTNFGEPIDTTSLTSVSTHHGKQGNPYNVMCEKATQSSWLLKDDMPGHWEAHFSYPIRPSMLRLFNVHRHNRGTKTFSVTARGSDANVHLSYTDPATGRLRRCSRTCPLSNHPSVHYQDFIALDKIEAQSIRINIETWYGAGGGLGQVQIFQKDTIIHPQKHKACSPNETSSTTIVGHWKEKNSHDHRQKFLYTSVPLTKLETSNVSIIYRPSIPAQGYYDVYVIIPQCDKSDDCQCRSSIDLDVQLDPESKATVTIDQATHNDTTILIYSGLITPGVGSMLPLIHIRPHVPDAQTRRGLEKRNGKHSVEIIAPTIQFVRRNTTVPHTLSSILAYNPRNTSVPAWQPLQEQLAPGSIVRAIDASSNDALYIGGEFASSTFQHTAVYRADRLLPISEEQLNGPVSAVQLVGSTLFVGGDFNGTVNTTIAGLNHVARLDVASASPSWTQLNMGVTGPVTFIVPSSEKSTVTISGSFTSPLAPESSQLNTSTPQNALWDVASEQWTERDSLMVGSITSVTPLSTSDEQRLWTGHILGAQTYRADAITFQNTTVQALKENGNTIHTGSFWNDSRSGESVVLLAHQLNEDTSQVTMVYRNGTQHALGKLTGSIDALEVLHDSVYVAGQFEGSANDLSAKSFIVYNLANRSVALAGQVHGNDASPGHVRVMRVRPDGSAVYIGGNFSSVDSMACSGLCVFDTTMMRWNSVGPGEPVTGQVYDLSVTMDEVIALGRLSRNQQTGHWGVLQNNTWTLSSLPESGIPTTMTQQGNQWFIAGQRYAVPGSSPEQGLTLSSNTNEPFLGMWDGAHYTNLLEAVTTRLGPSSDIQQLLYAPLTSFPGFPTGSNGTLLAMGHLQIHAFGNASAAYFDGSAWHPYLLTTKINGQPGRIRQMTYANPCCTATAANGTAAGGGGDHLSDAAVVLVSIAISVGIMFALTGLALLATWARGKQRGDEAAEPMLVWLKGQGFTDNALTAPAVVAAATAASATIATHTTTTTTNNHPVRAATPSSPLPPVPPLPPSTGNVSPAAATMSFGVLLATAKDYTGGPVSESNPRLCYAAHPFEAKEATELDLRAGDAFVVIDTDTDPEWWLGVQQDAAGNTVSGVFPKSHVQLTPPATE